MILQALAEYYQRADGLAPAGWEYKRIPFYIEIAPDGTFLQLIDRRSGPKPADVHLTLVPKAEIRSGTRAFERPNTLWDHYGFVLGVSKSDADKDKSSAKEQLLHFAARVNQLFEAAPESMELQAIQAFYESKEYKRVTNDPLWRDCTRIAGCNLTFRIAGQLDVGVHAASVRRLLSATTDSHEDTHEVKSVCLVTGETAPAIKLHYPIVNVGEKPAPLCATNEPAYWSFGKEKGFGFPVSADVNFRYTTALNHLLRPGSRQRMRIGDASAVFWTQKHDEIEHRFGSIFGGADDPNHTDELRAVLEAIHSGKFDGGRGDNRFYMLGLAPNAARISVRFWHVESLRDVARRIRRWFDDLKVARGPRDPEYPSLFRLLTGCAVRGEAKNIPPNLGGDIMRAVLSGGPYPLTWFNAAIQRCRAEQQVTYFRSAAIKACLNRSIVVHRNYEEEYQSMLDPTNSQASYRLGRLFAVLERIQEESAGGIGRLNSTIRDRYYGAACSTPASVFPLLLKLKNHHVSKLDDKAKRMLYRAFQDHRPDDYIGEVLTNVVTIPAHLALRQQGVFALGYYHQRHAFFTKAEPNNTAQEVTQ